MAVPVSWLAMSDDAYTVRLEDAPSGWSVQILDPAQRLVFERACADEVEARTFASTVRQHLGWLSEEKFRLYYRIVDDGGGA